MHKLVRFGLGALVTTAMVLGVIYLMNRTTVGSHLYTAATS